MNYVFKLCASVCVVTVCLSLCAADNGATGGCYSFNEAAAVVAVGGVVTAAAVIDAYTTREHNRRLQEENATLQQQNNGLGILTSAIDAGNRNLRTGNQQLQEVAAREGKCCEEQTRAVARLRGENTTLQKQNDSLRQQNNFLVNHVREEHPELVQEGGTESDRNARLFDTIDG